MPNSGKKEVTMNKVLFPKKDYVKELGRIFKSSKNSQKLVKTLSNIMRRILLKQSLFLHLLKDSIYITFLMNI